MEKFPIIKRSFDALKAELDDLKKNQRPNISMRIAEAREYGDLKENAEYHAARELQGFIEGRIADLEDKSSRCEVIDPLTLGGQNITFGAHVRLEDEETGEEVKYYIVGEYEADINKGFLFYKAPLARALIGKKKEESIEVITPKGTKEYYIKDVSFGELPE